MQSSRLFTACLSFALLAFLAVPAQAQQSEASQPNIVQTAQQAEGFNTLVEALQAAGLVEALEGDGPFTVFAPTDSAFAALGSTLDVLLEEGNRDQLRSVLQYHVVSGKAMASDVVGMNEATTLQGSPVGIQVTDGTVTLQGKNQATVVQTDIESSNGVIHVIDTVLMPPEDGSAGM
jgi:uncharacterized surface protein with fasciclin (FAS1) repeats